MSRSSRRRRHIGSQGQASSKEMRAPVPYSPPPPQLPQFHLSQHNYNLHAFPNALPPPDVLAGWKEVMDDAPERYFKYIESQAHHRQAIEWYVTKVNARLAFVTLGAIVVLVLSFLVAAVFLIATGSTWQGTALGTLDVASIVGAIAYAGRNPPKIRKK